MSVSRERADDQDNLDLLRQDSVKTRCVANGRERAARSCRQKEPKYIESEDEDSGGSSFKVPDDASEVSFDAMIDACLHLVACHCSCL